MKKTFLVFMLVILAGCTNRYAVQNQQRENSRALVDAVCEAADQSPEIDPIREYVVLNPLKATVAQLSLKEKPNSTQKLAIQKIDSVFVSCSKANQEHVIKFFPHLHSVLENSTQHLKILRSKLAQGEMTFGEYNTELVKLHTATNQEADAIHRSVFGQQQQLSIQRQQLGLQQMQYLNSLRNNMPKTTNCYGSGQNIYCTQY